MGNMKANRKFVEGEDAVSAVIGVILMVAITVAIAATVYVYVSGMIGSQPQTTPTITAQLDDITNQLQITGADPTSAGWSNVNISVSGADPAVEYGWVNLTRVSATAYNMGGTAAPTAWGDITAGDIIECGLYVGDTDGFTVTIRWIPTNKLIGSWDFAT